VEGFMSNEPSRSSTAKPGPSANLKPSEPKERPNTADPRLIPGGAHGSTSDIGMSAVDPDAVPVADETP